MPPILVLSMLYLAAILNFPVSALNQHPNISYVPMPTPSKPQQITLTMQGAPGLDSILSGLGKSLDEFINRNSRGKAHMVSQNAPIGRGRINAGQKLLRLLPGQASHVPIIGNGASAKHELGHEFGLGHAGTRIWETQTKVATFRNEHDPFDPMTISPLVPAYNAPHIDFLGWFTNSEEAYAEDGMEYNLRLINDGSSDFKSLKAIYYEVPGVSRRFWFSYVKVVGTPYGGSKALQGLPGTAIAIHSVDAQGASTFLEGVIGFTNATGIRNGLQLELSNPTPTTIAVKIKVDPNWVGSD